MNADPSLDAFDSKRHFLRVLMQQGRVQDDADLNEQAAILLYRLHALAADLIGPWGGPASNLGFAVALDGADLRIGPGHYYVDGLLCELEPAPCPARTGTVDDGAISYFEQPDYPRSPADRLSESTFVVYLDVWERHVIALEDERIGETASGGPDTATRSKLVWQVKVLRVSLRTRDELEQGWRALVERWQPADRGAMAARIEALDDTNPCLTPPGAGYRGLENHLYRVEIVRASNGDPASFAWSRDDGVLVSGWEQEGDELRLVRPCGARKLGLEPGTWIELTDDVHELNGRAGTFVQVKRADEGVVTIDPVTATGPTHPAGFDLNPKIKPWNSDGPQRVEVPASTDGWIPLEDGIQVKFSDTGDYRGGDYWLIPARVGGGVVWPSADGEPIRRPPDGVHHHYAPLALFVWKGTAFERIDCRRAFAWLAT
jgi:uncharacterized protein DUF6519